MYLHTKSGKRLVSMLAALSAFVFIESAVPLTASAASLSSAAVVSEMEAPVSGGTSTYGTGTITASRLNVRSGRGTNYAVLTSIPKGKSVTLLDKKDGWYQVTYNGKTGWIAGNYVKVSAALVDTKNTASTTTTTAKSTTTTTAAASSNLGKCTVTVSTLNVRSGPGTNYSIISKLSKGQSVQALEKKGSWVKVTISGSKTGWVSGSYVKFGSSGSTATTQKTASTTSKTTATTKKTTTTTSSNKGKSTSTTGKIVITADVLNARSGASKSSSVVGSVRRNEVYAYKNVKDGWYQITIPSGATAYVSSDYVKPFTDYAVKGGGSYLWPVQSYSRISSLFGPRDGRNHYGVDIAAPGGAQIMAVAPGKVIRNSYDADGYGYFIVIQQNDGLCAYYAHMKAPSFLKVGATVKAGDTIGLVGTTGHSTGNHLHLEFRRNGTRINPLNYYPNMQ